MRRGVYQLGAVPGCLSRSCLRWRRRGLSPWRTCSGPSTIFKEWKSYANLHTFDTANRHIAAGLIWASLCADMLRRFLAHAAQRVGGGTAISTRRVAMCAHLLLAAIVEALLRSRGPHEADHETLFTPAAVLGSSVYGHNAIY